MKFQVKPYEVPRRPGPNKPRQEIATASPKSLPAYNIEAKNDNEVRRLIRERYRQQGRTIRSLNHIAETQLVVYVESK